MTQEKEAFLDRWSRLKKDQPAEKAVVPGAKEEAPPRPLQPVEELKADSDFTPFMDPRVDPATRRSALKALFADDHYKLPDLYEAYSGDYTQSEPIPEKMLKAINRVRDVAVQGEEKVAEEERLAQAARADAETEPPEQEPNDVAGKQDA